MSDRTLVERARAAAPEAANGAFIRELGDRIAELEAERDKWHGDAVTQMKLRIEAEAERDRLKATVNDIAQQQTVAEHEAEHGEDTGDIEGAWDMVICRARSALAPAEGEGR